MGRQTKRPRTQPPGEDDKLTRHWRSIFLGALADTSNVSGSARLAGVTPSTVYSLLQPERRDVSAVTVKKLCDGLDLCIIDFYDCDLFRNLPPEIE